MNSVALKLSGELCEQAERLAKFEPKRPKQASLRRSISTAYFGLFHFTLGVLAETVVSNQIPGVASERIRRSISHSDLKDCFNQIRQTRGNNALRAYLGGLGRAPSAGLVDFANVFCAAQEERHDADYDVTQVYKRRDALILVSDVKRVIQWAKNDMKNTQPELVLVLTWVLLGRART